MHPQGSVANYPVTNDANPRVTETRAMKMNSSNNRTSRLRGVLLASAAGVALVVSASASGLTELAPWTAGARAAESAPAVTGGVPGFADLISQVEPAVVSVRVQLKAQTAALDGRGAPGRQGNDQTSPFDRFFQ